MNRPRPRRRRPLLRAVLGSFLALAPLLLAAPAAPGQEPAGEEATAAPLPATVDPAADAAIARGLAERLSQLEGLSEVRVEVEAGVVRLSGRAMAPEDREVAARIARRTAGVAEVIDEIELSRDLEQRVTPALTKLADRFRDFVAYLPLLGVALAVILVFATLGRWVARWRQPFRRLLPNRFVEDLVRQLAATAVLLVGVLLALEILDATALVGAVLGTAGLLGLAVGFAFRDLAENYISSVLLSLRQPFAPNDLVSIDGKEGKVVRLTSRATILMTLDGNHLRIPNSAVFKGVILNYTRNPLRRFDFGVGIGAGEDLAAAQRRGLEVLGATEGVLAEPAPWAEVAGLGDSSVPVRFYAWVDQRQVSLVKVRSRAIIRVKAALEEAGFDLPEPIYRVQLGRRGAAEAAEPAAKPRAAAPEPAADVSAEDPIDRQIADDRAASRELDLLAAEAPRE